MLWILVMNELLERLRATVPSVLVQGYADDTSLMQGGKVFSTLANRLVECLRVIQRWCEGVGLKLNPAKTEVILFTRNTRFKSGPMILGDASLEIRDRVKYLGVVLDRSLSWLPHCRAVVAKAVITLARCKRMIGRT